LVIILMNDQFLVGLQRENKFQDQVLEEFFFSLFFF
jgi:hypothetical protein